MFKDRKAKERDQITSSKSHKGFTKSGRDNQTTKC